jgi:hypothetical protein
MIKSDGKNDFRSRSKMKMDEKSISCGKNHRKAAKKIPIKEKIYLKFIFRIRALAK